MKEATRKCTVVNMIEFHDVLSYLKSFVPSKHNKTLLALHSITSSCKNYICTKY